jgi:hypothetical protein
MKATAAFLLAQASQRLEYRQVWLTAAFPIL